MSRSGPRELFLVWGPPSHGPRSRVFARTLGIPIEFVFSTRRRGAWVAPFKYAYQLFATLLILWRRRPDMVFVQSPPSLAPLIVAVYCRISGASFVVDAHSDAMLSPRWTRPRFLYRWMSRAAAATIVTNHSFAEAIERDGGTALVVRDIPTSFQLGDPPQVPGGSNIMVVSSFAADEPLAAIKEAARMVPDVHFHMTGSPDRADPSMLEDLPPNLALTGFLADEDYYALMNTCDAVMCLTTRDNTMQRGACEALSLGRPIITSDWPLLRDYFHLGTVHVAPTAQDIATGVERILGKHDHYTQEMRLLGEHQEAEWVEARERLDNLRPGSRRES